jgi:long-chain acyl-CoA synthetase
LENQNHIVDRKKDMVNVSGLKVFLLDVEVIVNGHPDIVESGVISVLDEKTDKAGLQEKSGRL